MVNRNRRNAMVTGCHRAGRWDFFESMPGRCETAPAIADQNKLPAPATAILLAPWKEIVSLWESWS